MLQILFSLWCVEIFFFDFIKALDLKGILNMLKKELHQPWNALTLQLSLSLRRTNEIAVFVSLFFEKLVSYRKHWRISGLSARTSVHHAVNLHKLTLFSKNFVCE